MERLHHAPELLSTAFDMDLPSVTVRVSENATRIVLITLGIIYGFAFLLSCLFAPWLVSCFDAAPENDPRPFRRSMPFACAFVTAYLLLMAVVLASLIAAVAIFKAGGGSNAGAIAVVIALPLAAAICAVAAVVAVRRRHGPDVVPMDRGLDEAEKRTAGMAA